MKYLLINDTSGTNNPGCRGTVACLRELLRYEGLTEKLSLPVCYGAEFFLDVSADLSQSSELTPWLSAKKRLSRSVQASFSEIDVVIVNAEGTIHHNQASALAILAIIEIAKDSGLPVIFLNATVQSMAQILITRVLSKCDVVLVREARSLNYLQSCGIYSQLAPDCLFTFGRNPTPASSKSNRPSCVYTPGVFSLSGRLTDRELIEQFDSIIEAGYSLHYLVAEKEDEKFLGIAESKGASIIGIADVPWYALTRFLSEYSLVVSGRYHISIYSWLARVPVVPLNSNTWKMEALFEFAEIAWQPLGTSFSQRLSGGGTLIDESTLDSLSSQCRAKISNCFVKDVLHTVGDRTISANATSAPAAKLKKLLKKFRRLFGTSTPANGG